MTPQDIREKIFEKAVFGGYDMGSVDDFMEEMASELEAAQRESATLKAKMKVLVDKIEEYRASEDAMRMTLLSAQKLSSQIEAEARARRTRSWPRPRPPRPAALTGSRARPAARRPASRRRRSPSPRFLEDARALCQRQLDFLNGNTAAQAAPASEEAVDAAVKSIEASVARIPDEPAPQIDISPVMGERAPRQTSRRTT